MVNGEIVKWYFLEEIGHFAQKFDSEFWEGISVYNFQAILPHQTSERSKKTQKKQIGLIDERGRQLFWLAKGARNLGWNAA